MKKIILAFMIVLFLASCEESQVISATSNIDWTQITDPFVGTNSLDIVYSIQNTGKVEILGYSILFEIQSGGATSNYGTKGNRQILPEETFSSPSLRPAGTTCDNCYISQGEILVDQISYSLPEGISVGDVQITKLHIWGERNERVYEY